MRILFVDLHAGELTALRDVVGELADMVVVAFDSEVDAELSRSAGACDLVVVVSLVWTVEGTELCRRVRTLGHPTPILAVTGSSDARQAAAAVRAGADDFLSSPFEPDEVLARAGQLLRRSPTRPRYGRAGPFLIDFWHRELFVDGRVVALTPGEYDLFLALTERLGEVVTRQELSARIHRGGAGGDSNIVDVHMSRIRTKLGTSGTELEAVRGRGYRLHAS